MATAIDPNLAPAPRDRKRAESSFFTGYMVVIAVVAFLGFAPSFFLRGVVPTAAPLEHLRPDMILHGVLATAFVLFLPSQAWLIASSRQKLHMKLGNWGFVLGTAFVVTGYFASTVTYHNPFESLTISPAALASLTIFSLAAFSLLLWGAWQRRFDAPAHKRLMVTAACLLMGPALVRIPIWPPPPAGLAIAEAVMLALFLPLWAWDLKTRGRPHWATVTGTAAFVIQATVRLLVMNTAGWAALVAALPGYGWP